MRAAESGSIASSDKRKERAQARSFHNRSRERSEVHAQTERPGVVVVAAHIAEVVLAVAQTSGQTATEVIGACQAPAFDGVAVLRWSSNSVSVMFIYTSARCEQLRMQLLPYLPPVKLHSNLC